MEHNVEMEYCNNVIIDGNEYELEVYSTHYVVYKNGKEISPEEFEKLLLECGLGMELHEKDDSLWPYWATFARVKTIEGVQGVYYDPDGNKWYSAWNETHPKATK